jgi:serine/threonine protein kinase
LTSSSAADTDLVARLKRFNLELHPDKTRLFRFGQFALARQRERGLGKPSTFDFLGLTHICGRSREGRFVLLRHSSKKRLRAKLQAVRAELLRRRHLPVSKQGSWLASVVRGYFAYHAVPTNGRQLTTFRTQAVRAWHHALNRRSQRDKTNWERMHRLDERWIPKPRILHPGEDLERRLRRQRRLSVPTLLHIIKQVAAALMATHAKGIVHRDLKPANIYLLEAAGAADFVKVLDFGISKVRSATTKLTRTASIMGTPGYMSPEQARGRIEDIDETTDQWALGCITWECLAGECPFQGESPLATLFQVVNEPPPPLLPKVPGLTPKVEDVLLRALSKNKGDRFANIVDFVASLDEATIGSTSKAAPSIPRTLQLSEPVSDTGVPAKSVQPTTFTQTAGELNEEVTPAGTRSKNWIWAVVGVAAILVVGALLLLRSGPAPKPVTVSPPPEGPVPVAVPAPAPEPTSIPTPPLAVTAPAPSAMEIANHDSPKTNRPSAGTHGPDGKASLRTQARPDSDSKRTHPVRQREVPRMIEDL